MTAEAKTITARVPLPLVEKVDQIASRLGRSRTWVIEQALSAWVVQEERDCLTQAALEDVAADRVIDHQAVQAWAESLDISCPPLPPSNRSG
ncbi:ribbon-helix-helix domain-containing protein [Pusillimonas sp.]|uniref:CopG family ribbon-helix-helix protein n=1 Tax=Pusillimonas sp. TaxID=3040095 RepID=UPI0029B918F8|nr:ribbon-helix-helix domain-containing protein [Pusillimonas sp.]MDX3894394.1 ribbon-helix-helix domain-containing protein [Pusillimonas sp.]